MEIAITKDTKLSVIFDAIASGRKCTMVVDKPVETVENLHNCVFGTVVQFFDSRTAVRKMCELC